MKNAFKGIISILDTTEEGLSDIEKRDRIYTHTFIYICRIYTHFYIYLYLCMLQYSICISDPEMIQKYTENMV